MSSIAPWLELAEVADRVIRRQNLVHRKPLEDPGMIHAGKWDFAEAFEPYIKKILAEERLRLILEYADSKRPSFGGDAIRTQKEINDLRFEIAKREYPHDEP